MYRSRKSDTGPVLPARDPVRVTSLASRALDVLAATRRGGHPGPAEDWVGALLACVTGADADARTRLTGRMRAAGIPAEDIVDLYIPAVARRLGEAWCDDRMSFADVSIGSARLQAMLRDERVARARDPVEWAGALMVLVLADPHHTLGATVLTAQLRRAGASVRLILGRSAADIDRIVAEGDYDAVLVSVARADDFSAAAAEIARLRTLTKGQIPLVVGGGIMELGATSARRATGADHATADPREAMERIGEWTSR